ncbi:MAG: carboxylating nicotinate-nucleotide diphosphorylase [Alphaproteobacteria bacterium]
MTDLAPLPAVLVAPLLARAYEEDLGQAGDVTTDSVVPAGASAKVAARARRPGRVAGAAIARQAFHTIDPALDVTLVTPDGASIAPGETILTVAGPAQAILTAERVALNFLGHLSGIATLTAAFVERVGNHKAKIVCTRKTTPTLRAVEKFAVRAGGGVNHRFGLYDGVLIKDNHIAVAGSITAAVAAARERSGHMMRVEVETDTLNQVEEALAAQADIILLDNMTPETLREAVTRVAGRAITEASGGVTLETVAAIAETGVDLISSGALTHSAPTLDIGLDFEAML